MTVLAQAQANGPDLAEFASDYFTMLRAGGDGRLPSRKKMAQECARMWAEQACYGMSDEDYHAVVEAVTPQFDYYF